MTVYLIFEFVGDQRICTDKFYDLDAALEYLKSNPNAVIVQGQEL